MIRTLLALTLLVLGGSALAQSTLQVRVGLVVTGAESLPPAVSSNTRQDLIDVMERTGRFDVSAAAAGESDLALVGRCQEDDDCWAQEARSRGLDLLIVAQLAPEGQRLTGIFQLVPAEGAPIRLSAELPRGGGAPLDLVDRSLLGPSQLRVYDPEFGLTVNGVPVNVGDPNLNFSAGKQLITLEAPGFEPRTLTVLLLPGPAQVVSGQLNPLPAEAPSRLRWSYVAAAGVLAGGTALAVVSAAQPGWAVGVR